MKVCVLGNSHAAALRQGLDEIEDEIGKRCEVTFFASRREGLRSLTRAGDQLVSTDSRVSRDLERTSRGLNAIVPNAYDLFLIHALEFRYDYAILQSGAYSQGFVAAWMWQSWMDSTAFHVLRELRALTRGQIVLSPQPYASAADLRVRGAVARFSGCPPGIGEIFSRCPNGEAIGQVRVLSQPKETIVSRVLTKPEYSRGSLRLDVGDRASGEAHPDNDYRHMNGKYGGAVWRQFVRDFC